MRYDNHVLDNGLQLVGEYHGDGLSLAAGFFCRTGSRDEVTAESGVSHFLEHMMFKGTATLSYDDINKTFDAIGAQYNAFTSEENTVYYGQVLPEFQADLVGLLGQMMRPAIRDEDFTMEKNVILEEIAMYLDMPLWVAHDHAREIHYHGHPLGNSVLGTADSIKALEAAQMRDYFRRRYAPDNLTFTITGKYDWDEVLAQVSDLTTGWEPSGAAREFAAVKVGQGVRVVHEPRFTQCHFYCFAPGISHQHPAHLVADVTAYALGGSRSSRLYEALVQPGLAEQASLDHAHEDQYGAYAAALSCEPDKAQQVLDILRRELDRAQTDGFTAEEIGRVTRKLASQVVLQAETPLSRLVTVGFDWIYRRDITPVGSLVEKIRAISAQECNALLADRPFDRFTAVCVGPLEELR